VRLVTFIADGRERVGVLEGEHVVDPREARALQLRSEGSAAEEAAQRASDEVPDTMIGFIEGGWEAKAIAGEAVEFAVEHGGLGRAAYPLADIKLRAPIPRPPMILNMGNAYRPYGIAGFSLKPVTGVVGPDEPIVIPREITDFGACYECEIGVVIGREGRRIPNDESAYGYVFGYTVYNDVTDYGKQMGGLFGSKLHDTFCPMGPCIVTGDELGDPHRLTKRAWINGQPATERSTREMLHRVHEFVSIPSQTLTLQPGAVISTGAPDVGRIKPGDTLELEITGIGRLRNPVIAEE